MKKLSDYKGDEAIELWADLLEPMTEILGDKDIAKILQDNKKPPRSNFLGGFYFYCKVII